MRAVPRVTFLFRFAVWLALAAVAMTLTPVASNTDPAAPQSHLVLSKLSRVRAVVSSERLPGSLTSVVTERRRLRGRPAVAPLPLFPVARRPVPAPACAARNTSFGTSRPLRC